MSESHPEHGITTPGGHGAHPEHGITLPSGPGGSTLQFTEEEWQQFRDSDLAGARAVVLLMGSIFIVGLLLYTTIDVLIW
jgi:hypothetical protein